MSSKFIPPVGELNQISPKNARRSFSDRSRQSIFHELKKNIRDKHTADAFEQVGQMNAVVLEVIKDKPIDNILWKNPMMSYLKKEKGVIPDYVEIRFRIPELHAHLPEPVDSEDYDAINRHPKAILMKDKAIPEVGDIVTIDFQDKNNFTGAQVVANVNSSAPPAGGGVCKTADALKAAAPPLNLTQPTGDSQQTNPTEAEKTNDPAIEGVTEGIEEPISKEEQESIEEQERQDKITRAQRALYLVSIDEFNSIKEFQSPAETKEILTRKEVFNVCITIADGNRTIKDTDRLIAVLQECFSLGIKIGVMIKQSYDKFFDNFIFLIEIGKLVPLDYVMYQYFDETIEQIMTINDTIYNNTNSLSIEFYGYITERTVNYDFFANEDEESLKIDFIYASDNHFDFRNYDDETIYDLVDRPSITRQAYYLDGVNFLKSPQNPCLYGERTSSIIDEEVVTGIGEVLYDNYFRLKGSMMHTVWEKMELTEEEKQNLLNSKVTVEEEEKANVIDPVTTAATPTETTTPAPEASTAQPTSDNSTTTSQQSVTTSSSNISDQQYAQEIATAYPHSAGFADKIVQVARNIGTNPYWLANLINFESAGTFDPSITNSLGYTGLIQFGTGAATDLGTTTSYLRSLDARTQMDFVQRYFELPHKRRNSNYSTPMDLYMAVFYPLGIGDPNYRFPDNVIAANNGIDTPTEYTRRANRNAKLPTGLDGSGTPTAGINDNPSLSVSNSQTPADATAVQNNGKPGLQCTPFPGGGMPMPNGAGMMVEPPTMRFDELPNYKELPWTAGSSMMMSNVIIDFMNRFSAALYAKIPMNDPIIADSNHGKVKVSGTFRTVETQVRLMWEKCDKEGSTSGITDLYADTWYNNEVANQWARHKAGAADARDLAIAAYSKHVQEKYSKPGARGHGNGTAVDIHTRSHLKVEFGYETASKLSKKQMLETRFVAAVVAAAEEQGGSVTVEYYQQHVHITIL